MKKIFFLTLFFTSTIYGETSPTVDLLLEEWELSATDLEMNQLESTYAQGDNTALTKEELQEIQLLLDENP